MGYVNYEVLREGYIDEKGSELLCNKYPMQLWKQAKGDFVISMWVNRENEQLWARRTDRGDAERLFGQACGLIKRERN